MVRADHLTQILGVEARRQRRRADQIAKHHRQLAALSFAGGGGDRGGCRWRFGRAERCDAVEQTATMADLVDNQLAQILAGEPAQHLTVDVVDAERGHIFLEPDPAQPFGYIDRSCPTPANHGPLQPPCGNCVQEGSGLYGTSASARRAVTRKMVEGSTISPPFA
jgi:hypothetical protein